MKKIIEDKPKWSNTHIHQTTHDKLSALAKKEKRTLSGMVEALISNYIKIIDR